MSAVEDLNQERRITFCLYEYWEKLAGEKGLPALKQMSRDKIAPFKNNLTLLDLRENIDQPTFQVIGQSLQEDLEEDLTHKTVDEVPRRTMLSRVTDHYREVLANRVPIAFEAEFVNGDGEKALYRGILLPFSDNNQTINFILGGVRWILEKDLTLDDTQPTIEELMNNIAAGNAMREQAENEAEAVSAEEEQQEVAEDLSDNFEEPSEDVDSEAAMEEDLLEEEDAMDSFEAPEDEAPTADIEQPVAEDDIEMIETSDDELPTEDELAAPDVPMDTLEPEILEEDILSMDDNVEAIMEDNGETDEVTSGDTTYESVLDEQSTDTGDETIIVDETQAEEKAEPTLVRKDFFPEATEEQQEVEISLELEEDDFEEAELDPAPASEETAEEILGEGEQDTPETVTEAEQMAAEILESIGTHPEQEETSESEPVAYEDDNFVIEEDTYALSLEEDVTSENEQQDEISLVDALSEPSSGIEESATDEAITRTPDENTDVRIEEFAEDMPEELLEVSEEAEPEVSEEAEPEVSEEVVLEVSEEVEVDMVAEIDEGATIMEDKPQEDDFKDTVEMSSGPDDDSLLMEDVTLEESLEEEAQDPDAAIADTDILTETQEETPDTAEQQQPVSSAEEDDDDLSIEELMQSIIAERKFDASYMREQKAKQTFEAKHEVMDEEPIAEVDEEDPEEASNAKENFVGEESPAEEPTEEVVEDNIPAEALNEDSEIIQEQDVAPTDGAEEETLDGAADEPLEAEEDILTVTEKTEETTAEDHEEPAFAEFLSEELQSEEPISGEDDNDAAEDRGEEAIEDNIPAEASREDSETIQEQDVAPTDGAEEETLDGAADEPLEAEEDILTVTEKTEETTAEDHGEPAFAEFLSEELQSEEPISGEDDNDAAEDRGEEVIEEDLLEASDAKEDTEAGFGDTPPEFLTRDPEDTLETSEELTESEQSAPEEMTAEAIETQEYPEDIESLLRPEPVADDLSLVDDGEDKLDVSKSVDDEDVADDSAMEEVAEENELIETEDVIDEPVAAEFEATNIEPEIDADSVATETLDVAKDAGDEDTQQTDAAAALDTSTESAEEAPFSEPPAFLEESQAPVEAEKPKKKKGSVIERAMAFMTPSFGKSAKKEEETTLKKGTAEVVREEPTFSAKPESEDKAPVESPTETGVAEEVSAEENTEQGPVEQEVAEDIILEEETGTGEGEDAPIAESDDQDVDVTLDANEEIAEDQEPNIAAQEEATAAETADPVEQPIAEDEDESVIALPDESHKPVEVTDETIFMEEEEQKPFEEEIVEELTADMEDPFAEPSEDFAESAGDPFAEPSEEFAAQAEDPFAEPSDEATTADAASIMSELEEPDEPEVVDELTLAALKSTLKQIIGYIKKEDANHNRSRDSLYNILTAIYEFHATCETSPNAYDELVKEHGLKVQSRAPFTPILKICLGKDYDKTRLTEYAAALGIARYMNIDIDEFHAFIKSFPGGIKGCVKEMRIIRKHGASGKVTARKTKTVEEAREILRDMAPIASFRLKKVIVGNNVDEFCLLLAKRDGHDINVLKILDDKYTKLDPILKRTAFLKGNLNGRK